MNESDLIPSKSHSKKSHEDKGSDKSQIDYDIILVSPLTGGYRICITIVHTRVENWQNEFFIFEL